MTRKPLLLLTLLALGVIAEAQNIEKVLHDRYLALDNAIAKKDVKAIERWVTAYVAPDFTYTSKDKRKYNRKTFLEGLKQQVGATKRVVKAHQHSGKPQRKGNDATVKVASEFEGWIVFDKRELRLVDKSETQDKWSLVNGQWKLKSSVQTKADTQIYQK